MKARLRRLNADYEMAQRAFANHPYIRLVNTEGTPPEKYIFALRVEGLVPHRRRRLHTLRRPSGGNFSPHGLSAPPALLPDDHADFSPKH